MQAFDDFRLAMTRDLHTRSEILKTHLDNLIAENGNLRRTTQALEQENSHLRSQLEGLSPAKLHGPAKDAGELTAAAIQQSPPTHESLDQTEQLPEYLNNLVQSSPELKTFLSQKAMHYAKLKYAHSKLLSRVRKYRNTIQTMQRTPKSSNDVGAKDNAVQNAQVAEGEDGPRTPQPQVPGNQEFGSPKKPAQHANGPVLTRTSLPETSRSPNSDTDIVYYGNKNELLPLAHFKDECSERQQQQPQLVCSDQHQENDSPMALPSARESQAKVEYSEPSITRPRATSFGDVKSMHETPPLQDLSKIHNELTMSPNVPKDQRLQSVQDSLDLDAVPVTSLALIQRVSQQNDLQPQGHTRTPSVATSENDTKSFEILASLFGDHSSLGIHKVQVENHLRKRTRSREDSCQTKRTCVSRHNDLLVDAIHSRCEKKHPSSIKVIEKRSKDSCRSLASCEVVPTRRGGPHPATKKMSKNAKLSPSYSGNGISTSETLIMPDPRFAMLARQKNRNNVESDSLSLQDREAKAKKSCSTFMCNGPVEPRGLRDLPSQEMTVEDSQCEGNELSKPTRKAWNRIGRAESPPGFWRTDMPPTQETNLKDMRGKM